MIGKINTLIKEVYESKIAQKNYGLKNVNDRIKLFYGTDYGLTVESVLNEKTIITLTIPVSN